MAPRRPIDRDNGMRRISSTTRWLAGAGVALVAAFSLLFAERAASSSSGGSSPAVNAPVATAPPATDAAPSGSSAQPVATAPPVTYPPVRHTHSGGS